LAIFELQLCLFFPGAPGERCAPPEQSSASTADIPEIPVSRQGKLSFRQQIPISTLASVTLPPQTARAGLCEVVTDTIRAQVRISTVSPAEVPVDSVDSIIRREYSERGQGATLYIMNPEAVQAIVPVPVDKSTASRYYWAPYLYSLVARSLFHFELH
jgi:hypothetical protein